MLSGKKEEKQDMKERKYKEDWANEIQFDERTGREKQVPVYRGSWFAFRPGQKKQALALWALLPWLGFLALVMLYFLLDFPGTRIMYVFLPAALSLFPCLYWAMGIWGLCRAPQKMTRLQKETGIGRVLRSSAACVFFACAALVGEVIFLVTGGDPAREWPGLLMLAAAAALAFGTANTFRSAGRQLTEERNTNP